MAGVAAIWEATLGRTGIREDDNFFDLGGHSLLAVQVVHEIRRRFGRSPPLSAFLADATVRGLAAALGPVTGDGLDGGGAAPDAVVVPLRESGAYAPLFCVPAAGASALTYVPLARLLTGDQPVYALQFPAGGSPDGDCGTVEQTAARFLEHVQRVQPRGPYRLCGRSYGALLAYEMARQILGAGGAVELLAMFDGMIPGSRRRLPLYRRVPLHLRKWGALGPAGAARDVARKVRKRLGLRRPLPGAAGAAAGAGPDEAAAAAAARGAQYRAFRAYRPPPYAGVITLFRATAQPDWVRYDQPSPFNGWDAVCERVDVHPVPGDHLSMLGEPHLAALAAALNAVLAKP